MSVLIGSSGREADAGAEWRRGVGGQALRSTQRRCGAVNVESEADVDGPQVTPEGAESLVGAASR